MLSGASPWGRETYMTVRREALRFSLLGSVLALFGVGRARAAETDALTIEPDGATIFAKRINFGNRLAELLTLWSPTYGIGIQSSTFYQRSDKNFAWYKGGSYSDRPLDPGGGQKMMSLTDGNLDVAGTVKAQSLETSSGVSLAALQGSVASLQSALNLLIPVGTIMAYGGDTKNANITKGLKDQG